MAGTQAEAHRVTREYYRLQIQERGIGPVIDEIDGLLKVFKDWGNDATFLMWVRQEVNNLAWEIENDK